MSLKALVHERQDDKDISDEQGTQNNSMSQLL